MNLQSQVKWSGTTKNLKTGSTDIAERAFERRFSLADHVNIMGAGLENGLLNVDIVREIPEAKKPKIIPVNGSNKKIGKLKGRVTCRSGRNSRYPRVSRFRSATH